MRRVVADAQVTSPGMACVERLREGPLKNVREPQKSSGSKPPRCHCLVGGLGNPEHRRWASHLLDDSLHREYHGDRERNPHLRPGEV